MARHQSLIEGRWRIVETELWDQEALDLVVPAYVRFDRSGLGEMELIAIGASIDYRVEQRDGACVLEFSSTSKTPRPPDGAAPYPQRGRPRQRGFRNVERGTDQVAGEAPAQWAPR